MKLLWYRLNDDGIHQRGYRIFDGEGEQQIFADAYTQEAAREITDLVNRSRLHSSGKAIVYGKCDVCGQDMTSDHRIITSHGIPKHHVPPCPKG